MKKRKIVVVVLCVILLISFIIPVKKIDVWVNDDNIADVGHYEVHHKNIYGITLKVVEE